jgi:prepilin peptidase CpaA
MTPPCTACLLDLAAPIGLLAGFVGLLIAAAIHDVRTMTIPNGISLAMALLYPIYAAVYGVGWIDGSIAGAGVLVVGAGFFALGWLGGGDVKLLAATALWAGTDLLLPALFVTTLAGGLLCLLASLRRGGPERILRRLCGAAAGRTGHEALPDIAGSAERLVVVPYAVAILAGGAFVAAVQLLPVLRLAETAL